MQIVIEIGEEYYEWVQSLDWENGALGYDKCWIAIHNGTPLPKGHGDLIDAGKIRFENAEFDTYGDYCRAFDAIDQADTIIEADPESEG